MVWLSWSNCSLEVGHSCLGNSSGQSFSQTAEMIKGGLPKGIKYSGGRLMNWKRWLGLFRERMSLQKPLRDTNVLSAPINV